MEGGGEGAECHRPRREGIENIVQRVADEVGRCHDRMPHLHANSVEKKAIYQLR